MEPIMSRFLAVRWITPGVIVAAQVECAVWLITFGLRGAAWWNDQGNDRRRFSLPRCGVRKER
jgi:hypothetical protein